MRKARLAPLEMTVILLALISTACASAATPTAVPTNTPLPPPTLTATATLKPTSTPKPTATPNLAATQEMDSRLKLLDTYVEAGYITSPTGKFENLDDFHEEWAQLRWYQWWPIHAKSVTYADLIFHGHFAWQTALKTNDLSGCGIVFGVQPNSNHYAVFIDKARIAFMMNRGSQVYQVGKTRGSGRLSIAEPAEADVVVIINGTKSYVLVDGDATEYTLSMDQSSSGGFAYSLLSGTNKDFGTRCDITDAYIWTPAK